MILFDTKEHKQVPKAQAKNANDTIKKGHVPGYNEQTIKKYAHNQVLCLPAICIIDMYN